MISPSAFAIAALPPFLAANLGWFIAGAIVLLGLFVYGLADVLRFTPRRIWAISGVCFAESIRRRVLWITPLAILGVIVVAQLQKATDEQDVIRQTTKFCLFATGMVVVITTVILACTNLPKEIENRVIFTIVTKPTTRLEIVLGKIVGFARVSGAILIIMGLFTWGYLHLRAISLTRDIAERLNTPGAVETVSRPTLEHYRDAGLLNAKTISLAGKLQIYGRLPKLGEDRYFLAGDSEGDALIPFLIDPAKFVPADARGNTPGSTGLAVQVRVGWQEKPKDSKTPATSQPFLPTPLLPQAAGGPQISVAIDDELQYSLIASNAVNGGKPIDLAGTGDNPQPVVAVIQPPQVELLLKHKLVFVHINGVTPGYDYWVDSTPVQMVVPGSVSAQGSTTIQPTDPTDPTKPGPVILRGRQGSAGEQLHGVANDTNAPVAIYHYRNANVGDAHEGEVPVEFRAAIERGSADLTNAEIPTDLNIFVRNTNTASITNPIPVMLENNRTAFFNVPASAFEGGNFDVIIRLKSEGQWIGMNRISLGVVTSQRSFAWNLAKSLLVIWLLSILVVMVSVFCSTFLSWPIAIVLTLVILLGHWGVDQLGDAANAGLGRQFVQDFGVRDPAQAEALSQTVEKLNGLLNTVSIVLPDISQFSPTEDIERGLSLPYQRLTNALGVVLGFGLPLTVLSYVFLRNKEVAP